MTTTPKRCVLYARLSVTKEESVSIARQLEACRKYAEGRGWEVVGEFVDDGVSATANRPEDRAGWRSLMHAHGFQAVVVWKIDRLARRVLDFLHVDEVLRGRNAGLVAVEDPIDMTTPMGRAFATILAVFGEMEAAAIASRVSAARAHMVKEGRWPGGGVPYGYMAIDNPDGAGRVLTHDPDRIVWLRQIITKAQSGDTISGITTWLDTHEAPLPRKAATRSSGHGAWNRQAVGGILRNPILAGATRRNPGKKKTGTSATPFSVLRDESGEPVINPALAVMTWSEFESLISTIDAAALATPQGKPFTERARTSSFLSKVARCDDCSVYMCRGTNQQRAVLQCPQCRQTISRAHLDPYLEERLLADRGSLPDQGVTVSDQWRRAWADEDAKRDVFKRQLGSLRIRRGLPGRRFDVSRVLLAWCDTESEAA